MAEQGESAAQATGGCLCGGVRFVVSGPLRPVLGCHCRTCRRTSGHHVAATAADRDQLRFEADETLVWWRSSDSATRGFCQRCGSNLFFQPLDESGAPRERISIFAGAIDGPVPALIGHIFTGEQGDYYVIDDGTPCFAEDWEGPRPEGWSDEGR